jgi:hypothetical protein
MGEVDVMKSRSYYIKWLRQNIGFRIGEAGKYIASVFDFPRVPPAFLVPVYTSRPKWATCA